MHALFLCLLLIFDSILSSLHPSYIFLPQAANKCLVRLESHVRSGSRFSGRLPSGDRIIMPCTLRIRNVRACLWGSICLLLFSPSRTPWGRTEKTPAKTGVSWSSLRRPGSAAGDGPCHHHPCPCVPLSRNENKSTAHLQLPECLSHRYLVPHPSRTPLSHPSRHTVSFHSLGLWGYISG